jgi:hypothetical protein
MTTTDTALYRSLHKDEWPDDKDLIVDNVPAIGILYPDFEEKVIIRKDKRTGEDKRTVRAPDVQLGYDSKTRETMVKSGGGTSLWDKANVLRGPWWRSFTIPSGTIVPDSLVVRKTHYDKEKDATHYQIEVRMGEMAITGYKGALDNLARNAVVRAIELSKGVKTEPV